MSTWRAGGSLVLVIAIALAGLACIAGWLLVTVEAPRTPHVMTHELPDQLRSNREALHVALESPLFWESRQPLVLEEPVVQPEVAPETLEGVRLVGIVADTALLKEGEVVRRVRRGAKFNGFVLDRIEGNRVTLISPSRTVELKIVKEAPSSVVLKPLKQS